MRRLLSIAAALGFIAAFVSPGFSQGGEELPRFGMGVKMSTLGVGIEAATAVTSQSNVRGGFNTFTYSRSFTQDGINYGGDLKFRSVEAHYDWFLARGFRVSPGLIVYNGNKVEGTAGVPGGQSFTLGGGNYISSPADPIKGTAKIDFSKNKVSPMLTAGVGNLLRRSGRRFSVNFEAGVIFESQPQAALNLAGSACVNGICQNVASYPQIQADIRAEQDKINNGTDPYDVVQKVLKYYPVFSIGFGYRFK